MLDSSCGHDVWTRPEPSQGTAIDSHLQEAADVTADVIELVGFDKLSISLFGNPLTVPGCDRAALTAGHQSIRPFREDRS